MEPIGPDHSVGIHYSWDNWVQTKVKYGRWSHNYEGKEVWKIELRLGKFLLFLFQLFLFLIRGLERPEHHELETVQFAAFVTDQIHPRHNCCFGLFIKGDRDTCKEENRWILDLTRFWLAKADSGTGFSLVFSFFLFFCRFMFFFFFVSPFSFLFSCLFFSSLFFFSFFSSFFFSFCFFSFISLY